MHMHMHMHMHMPHIQVEQLAPQALGASVRIEMGDQDIDIPLTTVQVCMRTHVCLFTLYMYI